MLNTTGIRNRSRGGATTLPPLTSKIDTTNYAMKGLPPLRYVRPLAETITHMVTQNQVLTTKDTPISYPTNGTSAYAPTAALAEREAGTVIQMPQLTPVTAIPRSIFSMSEAQYNRMEKLAGIVARSQLTYKSGRSSDDLLLVMLKGVEIGLEPMAALDLISVIQGKPALSPQGMLALINRSGELEDMTVSDDGMTATCTMIRKGRTPHTERFSAEDAKTMKLNNKDNWEKQPRTMRKWRVITAACRVVFPDIIQGLYSPEELNPDVILDDNGEMVAPPTVTLPAQDFSSSQTRRVPPEPEKTETPQTTGGVWMVKPDDTKRLQTETSLSLPDALKLLGTKTTDYASVDELINAVKVFRTHGAAAGEGGDDKHEETTVAAGKTFVATKVTVKTSKDTRKIELISFDGKQSASVFSIEKFLLMLTNGAEHSTGLWREWLEEITDKDGLHSLLVNMHCDLLVTWETRTSGGKEYHNAVTLTEIEQTPVAQ